MSITPISPAIAPAPITPPTVAGGTEAASPSGFADLVKKGLEGASQAEFQADALVQKMAAGEAVQPHEVLMATNKAQLAVSMVTAVRDKALEAYRDIMNMQV